MRPLLDTNVFLALIERRMRLLAQCQIEGLRLVTADRALVFHPVAASTG